MIMMVEICRSSVRTTSCDLNAGPGNADTEAMKILAPTLLSLCLLASPAWAAEATLEGYGGDGALLVGIDSGDSPFAGAPARGPARRPNDGNLVAEGGTAPASATGSPAVPGEAAPAPLPGEARSQSENPGGTRDRQRPRSEPDRSGRGPSTSPGMGTGSDTPAQVAPGEAPPEPESSGPPSLPFTSLELALLLGGALGVLALGFAMSRLAAAAPRF